MCFLRQLENALETPKRGVITSDVFILQVFIESYYIPDNGDTEIQRYGPCPQESYKLVGRVKYIDI